MNTLLQKDYKAFFKENSEVFWSNNTTVHVYIFKKMKKMLEIISWFMN